MKDFNIKLDGLTYTVKFLNESPMVNGDECLGLIDYDRQEIYIAKDQHPELLVVTVLHELLHGLIHARGVKLGNLEEDTVNSLSRGLYQLANDNKDVVRNLIKALDND